MTTKERLEVDKPDPRWVPIRRGAIYCSPACGFDCKHADYLKAIENGDKLAGLCSKAGYGRFWVRRVHENMGWHFEAHTTNAGLRDASITVHKYSGTKYSGTNYWADIQVEYLQFEAHGNTPKLAIEAALAKAQCKLALINGLFESLRVAEVVRKKK